MLSGHMKALQDNTAHKSFTTFEIVKRCLTLPVINIRLWGDQQVRKTYEQFRSRHGRFFFIQRKQWGVALLRLPETPEMYLKGKDRQAVRTNRKHALTAGYQFREFQPLEHIDEILEINSSADVRQGRAMAKGYLEENALREYFRDAHPVYGVFDTGGRLCAYAHTPILGEAFMFSRLLGDARHLNSGIMYLLVSDVITIMTQHKSASGFPLWAMYDTYFGGSPGVRFFKDRCGFSPYKVNWSWHVMQSEPR
jgi:hypothetical protein